MSSRQRRAGVPWWTNSATVSGRRSGSPGKARLLVSIQPRKAHAATKRADSQAKSPGGFRRIRYRAAWSNSAMTAPLIVKRADPRAVGAPDSFLDPRGREGGVEVIWPKSKKSKDLRAQPFVSAGRCAGGVSGGYGNDLPQTKGIAVLARTHSFPPPGRGGQ